MLNFKRMYMIRINVTIEVESEVRGQIVALLSEMSELQDRKKGASGTKYLKTIVWITC